MRYGRFEDLPVWNTAIELAVQVYELTARPQFKSQYSLKDQIERSAVSVSNNIAEGFERGTNNELLAFIYIARGSSGEVRSMTCLLERLTWFHDLRADLARIKAKAESYSKQLKAWAKSLQDSDLKGERYVNEKTKRADQVTRDREEFLKELAEIRGKGAASGR
jgi:four helix bundle protein